MTTLTETPAIWGIAAFIVVVLFITDRVVKAKERRRRRRSVPMPDLLVPTNPSPPNISSTPPLPAFAWPQAPGVSLASAVLEQIPKDRALWSPGDATLHDLCLLANCLEGQGDHFDQLYTSDGMACAGSVQDMIDALNVLGTNGLDRVMQRASELSSWSQGEFQPQECRAALDGVLADPLGRYNAEMCRLAALATSPADSFFPKLHALLVKRLDWRGAPEDPTYMSGNWASSAEPTMDRPSRPDGKATRLLAQLFHRGYLMRAAPEDTSPEITALIYHAARVYEAFDPGDAIGASIFDDALNSQLTGWLRDQGFAEVAENVAAIRLYEALRGAGVPPGDPRWPDVDRSYSFDAIAPGIMAASDAWLEVHFPWASDDGTDQA